MRGIILLTGIIILGIGFGLIMYGLHLESQMTIQEEVNSMLTAEGRAEQAQIALLEFTGVVMVVIGIIISIVGAVMTSKDDDYADIENVEVHYASSNPSNIYDYKQGTYNCYACKNPMSYVQSYQKWYCRSCNRYP
jgi:hypothetical protein